MRTPAKDTAVAGGIAAIFPTGQVIDVPRADGTVEKVNVMPLPLKKWAEAFEMISEVAPIFGFDLTEDPNAINTDLTQLDSVELGNKAVEGLTNKESSEQIYKFLCFATGLTREWWDADDLYDAGIDIAVAVIEVNLIFFVHKLLPKLIASMRKVAATGKEAMRLASAARKQ